MDIFPLEYIKTDNSMYLQCPICDKYMCNSYTTRRSNCNKCYRHQIENLGKIFCRQDGNIKNNLYCECFNNMATGVQLIYKLKYQQSQINTLEYENADMFRVINELIRILKANNYPLTAKAYKRNIMRYTTKGGGYTNGVTGDEARE